MKTFSPLLFAVMLFANVGLHAQAVFKDITTDAGIKHQFAVYEGMFGGGACVIDFDNDGFEDVYITGGMNNDVLYHNNGNGTFTNVFDKSGLSVTSHYVTQGVSGADINKDGWTDLFITTLTVRDSLKKIPRAENLVFLNNGNSTFRNVTKEYKIDQMISFSTGVSFGDINLDGYPDVYVGNYFQDYEGTLSKVTDETIVNANNTSRGYLLLNIEGKYFKNVYEDYGMNHKGFGFGAAFTDFDNDNDPDLFIHHDFGFKATPDLLMTNEYPDEEFKNVSSEKQMDLKINSMGTAIGDYNNDGLLDYYITNIRFNRLMVNQGNDKPFVDKANESGLGVVSISWGANFADFDNDTDLDLFVANGDLNPNNTPLVDYYFENNNGKFTDKASVASLADYGIGRGSVVFDMDNDGDLDLLVVNQKSVLEYPTTSETRLYRNDSPIKNWIKVLLKGKQSDKHGIGARVEVISNDKHQIREIDGGSSHLSQNSTIAHIGLGDSKLVDSLVITWPGGNKQVLTSITANTTVIVDEVSIEKKNKGIDIFYGLLTVLGISALFVFYFKMRKR